MVIGIDTALPWKTDGLVRLGRRLSGPGVESWVFYAVFPRTLRGYRRAIALRSEIGGGFWRGPGRAFLRPASISARGRRVLVAASGGLDI